jgi:ribosomal protein L16 Arg81 hydroxylase
LDTLIDQNNMGEAEHHFSSSRKQSENIDQKFSNYLKMRDSNEDIKISQVSESPERVPVRLPENQVLQDTESPILFLDVNFGGDKLTRIVMYKGN